MSTPSHIPRPSPLPETRTSPTVSGSAGRIGRRLCLALVVAAGAIVFPGHLTARSGLTTTASAVSPPAVLAAPGPLFQEDTPTLVDAGTFSRWLGYVAVMLMIGSITFSAIVVRALGRVAESGALAGVCYRLANRWGVVGSVAFLVASAGRLLAQTISFLFPGDPLTWVEAGTVLFHTNWGGRWMMQVGVAVVAAVGFGMTRRQPRIGWFLAVSGAMATAVALPLTGHAMAASWPSIILLPLQALHVIGGSAWLGSLLVLVLVAFGATLREDTATQERTVAQLVHVFSPVALAGVAVAVAMGVVLSVSYLGSVPALWQSVYGQMLLIKVALLAATSLLGAYNWRRLRPRLGTPGSASRLFLSARMELLFGALLLAATAMLVALPAPHV